MSVVTEVMDGNDESECVKLGSAAIEAAGVGGVLAAGDESAELAKRFTAIAECLYL